MNTSLQTDPSRVDETPEASTTSGTEESFGCRSAAEQSPFYSASSYCAEQSIGYLMKRVLLSIVTQVDRRIDVHDLTSAQWGPLMRLQTAGASTVAELARFLNVDAGAMTRLLDRLEKKGLCKRVRSTEDRRVVQVELTPAGGAAIAQVPPVLCEVLNAHLAGFSHAEWQTLQDYLTRMLRAGEAFRDGATPPVAGTAAASDPTPDTGARS